MIGFFVEEVVGLYVELDLMVVNPSADDVGYPGPPDVLWPLEDGGPYEGRMYVIVGLG